MPTNLLWADDDSKQMLFPLERFLVREGAFVIYRAESYSAAMAKLIQLDHAANSRIQSLLADIILPHGVRGGALATDLGLTLAERAAQMNVKRIGFLTVVRLEEVNSRFQRLEKSFPKVAFGHFDKVSLLEPGRIEALIDFLSRVKTETEES